MLLQYNIVMVIMFTKTFGSLRVVHNSPEPDNVKDHCMCHANDLVVFKLPAHLH